MSELEVKSRRETTRVLLIGLFVVYLLALTWVVLWKLGLPNLGGSVLREVKLVPFVSTSQNGPSQLNEVVANLALFVPFGIYLGLVAPAWPWWKKALLIAGVSLAFEVAQYVMALGSTDVTDVIVNTAGGLAGITVLALARRSLRGRTATVFARVCAVGTLLALVAVGLFLASPVRFGPPMHGPGDNQLPRSSE